MPDITMCATQFCPLEKTCYRNPKSGTKPDEKRQSWSLFHWDEDTMLFGEKVLWCNDYWPTEPKRISPE